MRKSVYQIKYHMALVIYAMLDRIFYDHVQWKVSSEQMWYEVEIKYQIRSDPTP